MPFIVRKGVPEILEFWKQLLKGHKRGTLDSVERELFKKWVKAVAHLRENPFHPGLESHEIDTLSERFGRKVFQSYLENRTPAAGRLFWAYGPKQGEITIIGFEPHPEDAKSRGYDRVPLSELPPLAPAEVSPPQPIRGKRR